MHAFTVQHTCAQPSTFVNKMYTKPDEEDFACKVIFHLTFERSRRGGGVDEFMLVHYVFIHIYYIYFINVYVCVSHSRGNEYMVLMYNACKRSSDRLIETRTCTYTHKHICGKVSHIYNMCVCMYYVCM